MTDQRVRINGKEYVFIDTDGDGIPDKFKEVHGGLFGRLTREASRESPDEWRGEERGAGPLLERTGGAEWDEARGRPPTSWERPTPMGEGEEDEEENLPEAPALRGCMTVVTVLASIIAFVIYVAQQGGIDGEQIQRAIEEYAAPFMDQQPPAKPSPAKARKTKPAPKATKRPAQAPPTSKSPAAPASGADAVPVFEISRPTDAPSRSGRPPVVYLSFDDTLDGYGEAEVEGREEGDGVRFVSGVHGAAAKFNGDASARYADTEYVDLAGGYTIEFWLRLATGRRLLTSTLQSVIASDMVQMFIRSPRRADVNFMFGDDSGFVSMHLNEYEVVFEPGRWYHLAMVYDPSADKYLLFANGAKLFEQKTVFAGESTPFAASVGQLVLGNSARGSEGFDGALDELYIYDYPRSAHALAAAAQRQAP